MSESPNIHCRVLLFAHLRDAIGREQLEIEWPAGSTVELAVKKLASEYPAIAAMLRQRALAVAINQQYVQVGTVLRDGDTLALIPPVSGG